MAIFNRILNVLVFLLAIGAAVGAWMLAEKRQKLVNRGNEMAKAIHDTAKILDDGSGTNTASKVAVASMDKFDNLPNVLPQLKKQAEEVIAQRKALGETMKKVTDVMRIPEFRASDFENVNEYEQKDQKLVEAVTKDVDRNDKIVTAVVKTASKVGHQVDESALKNNDTFEKHLEKIGKNVAYFKEKHDKLAEHAQGVARALGLRAPEVGGMDENYASVLDSTRKNVEEFKRKADATEEDLRTNKKQVILLTKRLENTANQLADAEKDVEKIKGIRKKLEQENKKLANKLAVIEGRDDPNAPKTAGENLGGDLFRQILDKTRGKIVSINKKWGFVVIDLGKDSKVEIKFKNGNRKEVSAAPIQDRVMMIARDMGGKNEFVGKIKVNKVYDVCAIASVLPEPKTGKKVQVGDIVYIEPLPEKKKEEKKAEAKDAEAAPAKAAAEETKAAPKKAEEKAAEEDDGEEDAEAEEAAEKDEGGDDKTKEAAEDDDDDDDEPFGDDDDDDDDNPFE